jgi:hypothetical protein
MSPTACTPLLLAVQRVLCLVPVLWHQGTCPSAGGLRTAAAAAVVRTWFCQLTTRTIKAITVPMTAQSNHFLSMGGPCPAAALGLLLMLPGPCLATFLGLPAGSWQRITIDTPSSCLITRLISSLGAAQLLSICCQQLSAVVLVSACTTHISQVLPAIELVVAVLS